MCSTISQLLLVNRQPPPVNMETYTGSDDDVFLVRRGALREPSPQYTPVFNLTPTVGPPLRLIRSLMDSELDNLVRTAFDYDDSNNTFRGILRAVINTI